MAQLSFQRQDRVTSSRIPSERLSDDLLSYAQGLSADRVTVRDVVRAMGRRSIAVLLLLFALPMALPVPTPGLSVLFGIPLMLVAAQLALGRTSTWLPRRVSDHMLATAELKRLLGKAAPVLRRFERVIRPRAEWIVGKWISIPVGLVCLTLATIITLPIPLGHVVPGTAICVLALGLLERDGVAIASGLAIAAAALVIIAFAILGLANGVHLLAR